MGCKLPPEGEVFMATRPRPGILAQPCAPKVRPSKLAKSASGTGFVENLRQVRRSFRMRGNSPAEEAAGKSTRRAPGHDLPMPGMGCDLARCCNWRKAATGSLANSTSRVEKWKKPAAGSQLCQRARAASRLSGG